MEHLKRILPNVVGVMSGMPFWLSESVISAGYCQTLEGPIYKEVSLQIVPLSKKINVLISRPLLPNSVFKDERRGIEYCTFEITIGQKSLYSVSNFTHFGEGLALQDFHYPMLFASVRARNVRFFRDNIGRLPKSRENLAEIVFAIIRNQCYNMLEILIDTLKYNMYCPETLPKFATLIPVQCQTIEQIEELETKNSEWYALSLFRCVCNILQSIDYYISEVDKGGNFKYLHFEDLKRDIDDFAFDLSHIRGFDFLRSRSIYASIHTTWGKFCHRKLYEISEIPKHLLMYAHMWCQNFETFLQILKICHKNNITGAYDVQISRMLKICA